VEFIDPGTRPGKLAAGLFSLIPAVPITIRLARFDALIGERGIAEAADWLLHRYYSGFTATTPAPKSRHGALLFANHVGLADVLALLSWWGWKDTYLITRERSLLHALPSLNRYIISIGSNSAERKEMIDRVTELLRSGAHVLLFPAGAIETDPWNRVSSSPETLLKEWPGLIGYLINQARRRDFHFTIQPVLTGNVYARAARRFVRWFCRHCSAPDEVNKIQAFFTFVFRLSRKQPVRLIPDRRWESDDVPQSTGGKKAMTSFFRNRLLQIAETAYTAAEPAEGIVLHKELFRSGLKIPETAT
jgi:hypothetical protein